MLYNDIQSQASRDCHPDIECAGLGAAVEQSADAILITDTSGNIRYVNPAFTAISGYSREEAVGQNPRIVKSGRQSPEFYKEIWVTIASGQVWRGELINRRKDGTLYTEEMRITPVRNSDGEIVSYIAIKQDVTERRAAEEAKRFLASIGGVFRGCHRFLHSRRYYHHLEPRRRSGLWLLRSRRDR